MLLGIDQSRLDTKIHIGIGRSIVGNVLYCGGVISLPYMLDLTFNDYDVDKEYLYIQLESLV
jgi:hypothetical protein